MRGFGGMVSFTVRGGEARALAVAASTSIFTLAESLGAVESLIEHPHRMTHASLSGSALAVDPALLRLSVGIERVDDLVADLFAALEAQPARWVEAAEAQAPRWCGSCARPHPTSTIG